MEELKKIVFKTPVVLLLNAVDPFCMAIQDQFQNLSMKPGSVEMVFVDSRPDGAELEKNSKLLASLKLPNESVSSTQSDKQPEDSLEKNPLPHVYLHGQFFFGGQGMASLSSELESRLVDMGAIELPMKDAFQSLISSHKIVCFLNNYSTYSQSAKDTLEKYQNAMKEEDTSDKSTEIKLVYTDKVSQGKALEKAALHLSGRNNLPLIYVEGQLLGSYDALQNFHASLELESKLVSLELLSSDPEGLELLKNKYRVLVVGNSFSPWCLGAVEALTKDAGLRQLQDGEEVAEGSKGVVKVVADDSQGTKSLIRAAKLSSKQLRVPYVFVKGVLVPEASFQHLLKEKGALEAELRARGVL